MRDALKIIVTVLLVADWSHDQLVHGYCQLHRRRNKYSGGDKMRRHSKHGIPRKAMYSYAPMARTAGAKVNLRLAAEVNKYPH